MGCIPLVLSNRLKPGPVKVPDISLEGQPYMGNLTCPLTEAQYHEGVEEFEGRVGAVVAGLTHPSHCNGYVL